MKEHKTSEFKLSLFYPKSSTARGKMNLFGKAKAAKTTPKDAIVRLRESLDMLEKREKYLQTKIDSELTVAKANATKNKRGLI
jgi:hypothetical protein